jgi:hypothetical protein
MMWCRSRSVSLGRINCLADNSICTGSLESFDRLLIAICISSANLITQLDSCSKEAIGYYKEEAELTKE